MKMRSCVHALFSTQTRIHSEPSPQPFERVNFFNRNRNRDAPFWRGFDVSSLSTGSKSRGVGCSRPSFVSGTVDRGLRGTKGKMVKISPRDLSGEPKILFAIKSSCNRAGPWCGSGYMWLCSEVKPHLTIHVESEGLELGLLHLLRACDNNWHGRPGCDASFPKLLQHQPKQHFLPLPSLPKPTYLNSVSNCLVQSVHFTVL